VTERANCAPGAAPPEGGREIAFEVNGRQFTFSMPPPGDASIPSVFLVGLPKAGSTLLNRLMSPITKAAGLSYVSLQDILFGMGVSAKAVPREVNAAFAPTGFVFGGFRSLSGGFSIPPFAADRTVVLVRDPRDMLTSLYFSLASSHRAPGNAVGEALAKTFSNQRDAVSRTSIDEFVLEKTRLVLGQFRTLVDKLDGIPHRHYRYEDIIFEKLAWARDMVDYLGLNVPPALVERVVAANDVLPDAENPKMHVRKVVPGDHREKLRAETIAELDVRLKPILRRYRYL